MSCCEYQQVTYTGEFELKLQNSSKLLKCIPYLVRVAVCSFLPVSDNQFELSCQIFIYFTLLIEDKEIAISEFSQDCNSNHMSCNDNLLLSKPLQLWHFLYRRSVNVLFQLIFHDLYSSVALAQAPCT